MRQADDPDFQSLLDRVTRAACVIQDDITRLNSKVVTSIFDPRFNTATYCRCQTQFYPSSYQIRVECPGVSFSKSSSFFVSVFS